MQLQRCRLRQDRGETNTKVKPSNNPISSSPNSYQSSFPTFVLVASMLILVLISFTREIGKDCLGGFNPQRCCSSCLLAPMVAIEKQAGGYDSFMYEASKACESLVTLAKSR